MSGPARYDLVAHADRNGREWFSVVSRLNGVTVAATKTKAAGLEDLAAWNNGTAY